MSFCLPKEYANKFIDALKKGDIDPAKLAEMSSNERRSFFEKIVGKEDAKDVNALFESKLLLKDFKTGAVSWAKKVSGISEPLRKDLIARIENLDERVLNPENEKAFMSDLADAKLGTSVTMEEAKNIAARSKQLTDLKGKWDSNSADASLAKNPLDKNAGWKSEEDRLAYGYSVAEFRDYITELKNSNGPAGLIETIKHPIEAVKNAVKNPVATIKNAAYGFAGTTKAVLASLDNSFYGRQGIKTLYTHPTIWAKDFLQSWGDISKSLVGKDAMKAIQADVLSRPNAMNGNYQRTGVDVGINFEEAFPTTLQEHLPIIGRAFKAADVAFSGGAMRMRADLADMLIPKAEDFGLSMKNAADARGVGRLINGMTGRGYIGGASGKTLNVMFFSPKFLKSNFDTLTGHTFFQGDISLESASFLRKQAAINLVKIAGTTGFILATAKALNPNSTNLDPRSTTFGKIKVGATTIDITGGMGSLVTLAARLTPSEHNGKWSLWEVNSKGVYTDLLAGKYGQQTGLDVMLSFAEGKLSPTLGVLRDYLQGRNFSGQKPTISNEFGGMVTPLPIQTYMDLKHNPHAAPVLLGLIADMLGFNTYTPPR